jgi:DNA-binding XRE family transcriptional regulator
MDIKHSIRYIYLYIKKARIDRQMSQKTLWERVGVSQKQMSAIELDKADPRWSTVVKIAEALGVTLESLKNGNGQSSS